MAEDQWTALIIVLVAFPIVFVGMWLGVTALLGSLSGWFDLLRRYPDRKETPVLRLDWQSGTMGMGVGYRYVMSLSVCPSGLRVGVFKPFGIFAHDFFVPWKEITTKPANLFFFHGTELQFGAPQVGRLIIAQSAADRLAAAAGKHWPASGAPARR